MQVSSGASQQGDDIMLEADGNGNLTMTERIQSQIDDGLCISAFSGLFTGLKITNKQVDAFGAAAGNLSTVDTTSNTTATYDAGADTYKAEFTGTTGTEAHGVALTSNGAFGTGKAGFKITTAAFKSILTKITKSAGTTATKAYLLDNSKATLASADFSGNDATFNYELSASTNYYLACDNSGAAFDCDYVMVGTAFPVAGTNFNWVGDLANGADGTDKWLAIASANIQQISLRQVQSVALTTINGATFTQLRLHPYNLNMGAAGNAVDFDLSFTGASWDLTGLSVDAWHSIGVGTTLNGAKVRVNYRLGTASSATGPYMQGWAIGVA